MGSETISSLTFMFEILQESMRQNSKNATISVQQTSQKVYELM